MPLNKETETYIRAQTYIHRHILIYTHIYTYAIISLLFFSKGGLVLNNPRKLICH